MIAKISAPENLGGALVYNFKKVNKKEATLLLAHGLYQNRAGEYTMSGGTCRYAGIDTRKVSNKENCLPLLAQSPSRREAVR